MARKTRKDSVAGQLEAVRRLHTTVSLDCPDGFELSADEMDRFSAYVQTREEWSPGEARMIARLAQLEDLIQKQTVEIENEGHVVTLSNGVTTVNPRHKIVAQSERAALQLMGKLHLTLPTQNAQTRNTARVGVQQTRVKPTGPAPDWSALAKAL